MNDYAAAAMRTASEVGVLHAALGLVGEAGEVADHLKKAAFQGHPFDAAHLAEEVGDILWYCAMMAEALGMSLDTIAAANLQKLQERYPDGFSSERSVNRVR